VLKPSLILYDRGVRRKYERKKLRMMKVAAIGAPAPLVVMMNIVAT